MAFGLRHLTLQLPLYFDPGAALFSITSQISLQLRSQILDPPQIILKLVCFSLHVAE
jgi:hypothetical protein